MEPGIVWAIAASFAILLILFLVRKSFPAAWENGAAKRTRIALSRYALSRRFKVLSDMRFEAKEGKVGVQNVLIGFFGILLVHAIGARGEFYGELEGREWVLLRDSRRESFPNPHLEQQKAIREIRAVLSKNKVYNVPVRQVVVFTGISKETSVFIHFEDEIVLRGRLSAYLDRTKFDHDAGVDIERVASLLEPYCRKN